MGMGFISKCPQSFSSKVRDDIVHSVRSSFLEESTLEEGYGVYYTDTETVCGTLRFIGYRTPKDRSIGIRYLREQGDRLLSKAFTKPLRTKYHCRDDAMGYRVLVEAVEMEEVLRREGPGRPRKDSPPSKVERFWKLKVE